MMTKRFIIPFSILIIIYSILDFGFNNMMLYIMGGVIGGTISEAFKAIGVSIGMTPTILIWVALVIGLVALFYRLRNKLLKYFIIVIVAVLLYVIDLIVGGIPYSEANNSETTALVSKIVMGFLVVSKSLVLSFIVYFDSKNRFSLSEMSQE